MKFTQMNQMQFICPEVLKILKSPNQSQLISSMNTFRNYLQINYTSPSKFFILYHAPMRDYKFI